MLLRGPRMPFHRSLPEGHYFAMVSRGDRRPDCEVYPWTIQEMPPAIPIPLEAPDPDVITNLHEVYMTTFDRGPYDQLVRYDRPIGFPMDQAMEQWVGERLLGRKS